MLFLLIGVICAGPSCSTESRSFGNATTGGPVDCSQPEMCFDGVDNNCDGRTDCEDDACTPEAVCVPSVVGAEQGVFVAVDDACPPGYDPEGTVVGRGLQGGCTGCDCTANPISCAVEIWLYGDPMACDNDADLTGGAYGGVIATGCPPMPIFDGSLRGARTMMKATQTCEPTGTATHEKASWQESKKFCRASSVGGGCEAGKVCAPKQAPAAQCALVPGAGASCEGYATVQGDWFTGYNDTLSCDTCSCTAVGGSCDGMNTWLGSDWACTDTISIKHGEKWCGSIYSPPAYLGGAPVDPTCTVDDNHTGSLDATGPSTVCCLQ